MTTESRSRLFRVREKGAAVTNIELFFDLVFVFAITQLSHRLLLNLTPTGAVETLVLFLAIWWLWIYTCWATNWLDPEHNTIRVLLLAMMMGALGAFLLRPMSPCNLFARS
jgi:low temperature requirement protein LtrA